MKKHDPNHLNLGLRFGGDAHDGIIRASKNAFDVFSLNVYGYSISNNLLQRIYELSELPIVVGEFHFGTPGRGLAPGLAQVSNQKKEVSIQILCGKCSSSSRSYRYTLVPVA